MKPFFLITLAAAAGMTMFAQEPQIRVHLSQAVAAGDNWLQPGDYTISTVNTAGDTPVLRFESAKGNSVFVLVDKASRPEIGKTELLIENSGVAAHITKIDVEGSGVEYTIAAPTTHLVR